MKKSKINTVLHSTYGDIYSLKWRRGIKVKQMKSHIRLEVIIKVMIQ